MKNIKCSIEKRYGVDHSNVPQALREKFVILGSLFGGQPICSWCLTRLAIVADTFGYSQQRSLRGNAINVDAHVPQEELIRRSPLKSVFGDIDLADLKFRLDHDQVFELDPQVAIQPSIEHEMDKIRGAQTIRSL